MSGVTLSADSAYSAAESQSIMKPILLSLSLAGILSAGEFRSERVAPEAKWWLHADIAAAKQTAPGQRMVEAIETKHGDQLNALKLMFSVNPMTDLESITLFGDGRKDMAVALIEGRFNREHLEGLVKAADDYDHHTHASFGVHSWEDKGKRQHAAFASGDLLVFSHEKGLLHRALDVLASGSGLADDPFVSAESSAPFVVGSAQLSEVEMDEDESRLLRKAEVLKLAFHESGGRMDARMLLEAGSPADGKRFQRVMEGIIALGELSVALDKANEMTFTTNTSAEGRIVNSSISMPAAMMVEWMEAEGAFDLEDKAESPEG